MDMEYSQNIPQTDPMDFADDIIETPPKKKSTWKQQLFRDMKEIVVLLLVFMLVYVLCFRMVVVKGSSMKDTLLDGDRLLLISNLLYPNSKQGDVIVASKDSFRDGECIIKRVIAVEGQTVDIDFLTGTVYVDGEALEEAYIRTPTTDPQGMDFPLTVSEGCVFVMGDNRKDSMDSRHPNIGLIDEREILGKAVLIVFPGNDKGRQELDFSRLGVID